jgi:penicillin amidase
MRARRIHQMIEAKPILSADDFATMHQDALSLRAVRCLPSLLKVLASSAVPRIREAAEFLQAWDGRTEPDRIGATLFEVFFSHWTRAVVAERFDEKTAGFVAGGANGLSAALLADDPVGWFAVGKCETAVLGAMTSALEWLTQRLGPDMRQWNWGRLHTLSLRHILSGRGDLGQLLDHGGLPVRGNMHTVCNTGLGAAFESRTGASYRLVADLSSSPPVLRAVDSQSQSGHPGSPHYRDQFPTWIRGEYHSLSLKRAEGIHSAASKLTLEP